MIDPRYHPLSFKDYVYWGIFVFAVIVSSQLILRLIDLANNDQTALIESVALEKKVALSRVVLTTSAGDITIHLDRRNAPIASSNFAQLSASGFYNGTRFHRVVDGVLLQGGDPLSRENDRSLWGTGGAGYVFEDENTDAEIMRGVMVMANNGRPDTNSSQFFIVTATSAPQLEGKYTVFGNVTDGIDVVEKIMAREKDANGYPKFPVVIRSVALK